MFIYQLVMHRLGPHAENILDMASFLAKEKMGKKVQAQRKKYFFPESDNKTEFKVD